MRWWPFRKKREFVSDKPHIKGSKLWIQELREICERSYNRRPEGQRGVETMRSQWRLSHSNGDMGDAQLQGLERRGKILLEVDDEGWSKILDDDNFWLAGWGSKVED